MSNPISFLNQKDVTIKRLSYVGDKGTFGTVGTATGYLRPLSETQASLNGFQFGKAFALLVDDEVDLRESDTVTIDGEDFTVNGVANHDRLSIAFKRAIITKPES